MSNNSIRIRTTPNGDDKYIKVNLEQEFDFSKCKTFVIYASNGLMKTSFARTFSQLQKKLKPTEEYLNKKKLVGDNTDVYGFSSGILKKVKTRIKTAGIIGAGGVTSSIILALIQKGVKKIYISNNNINLYETENIKLKNNIVLEISCPESKPFEVQEL